MTARVLVTDSISKKGLELLEKKAEVDFKPDIESDNLIKIIGDYDGLIVRSGTDVSEEVIQSGIPRLKVVGRAGTGVDNIDIEAAKMHGVMVVNTPGANTVSVAEHTIALMLALARNITRANAALKKGQWERKKYRGYEVKGKKLGIIGLGRAGGEVAKRAQGLDMDVIAHDVYISAQRADKLGVKLVEFDELLTQSDFISLHIPLTEETEYMIDEREFGLMKDGVYIINCARGKIVNESALCEALKTNKVAGAALDVFEHEPLGDSPLLKLDNTIVIPHLGASTQEAMDRVAIEAAEQVLEVIEGKIVANAVNIPSVSNKVFNELKPYLPLAERMGRFCAQWMEGYIEELKIDYSGKLADMEVKLLTTSILKGLLDPILTEPVNLVNAPSLAQNRGIDVIESKRQNNVDYSSLITIEVVTDRGTDKLAGSLFKKDDYRLIMLDGYPIDTPLAGVMLVAYHRDQPGIIGQVGTILGEYRINIAKMQVGRKERGGVAVMVLGVDSEIPEAAFNRILKVVGVEEARMVKI